MLTLLSPAALWTLAALALPTALHLWRKPPRTVQMGSLRFLRATAQRRWRNLRWNEVALLAARLGLLAALALLLARPVWQRPPSDAPERWALLDPAAALDAPARTRLHALQTAGYSVRQLRAGFPATADSPTTPAVSGEPADLWSLLREADAALPGGSVLAIFSPARLASLQGVRPHLRSKLDWIETPDTAGTQVQVWIDSVRPGPSPGQTPTAQVGISNGSETRYRPQPPPGWRLETRADAARLVDPDAHPTAWTNATAPLSPSVLILHDADRAMDARFLSAAVTAALAEPGGTQRLRTLVIAPDLAAQPDTDWTFWLAATPPPETVLNRNTSLFQDARLSGTARGGWIVPQTGTPGADFLTPPVRFWQRSAAPPGTALWTDEHGVPLLTRMESAHGPRWHFASRFHPAWNDLPDTTALPALLRSWLSNPPSFERPHDLRQADARQAQTSLAAPTTNPAPRNSAATEATLVSLHWPWWTLVACLFCLERILSHRRAASRARIPAPLPAAALAR